MNNRTLTYVGAVIIALLLLSTVFALVSNSRKKRDLNAEKLRTESLLSEKLVAEKELDRLKNDLAILQDKVSAHEKLLVAAESELAQKERRIGSLSRANSALNKDRMELEELKKTKADLDRELADLKSSIERLQSKSNELDNSVTALESEKSDLVKKLQMTETYNTDNFQVWGSRGKNDNLTFRACRTKKLNINFEVPQSLTETISFKITTPSGTVITPDDKALAWTISQTPRNLTASLSAVTGEFEPSRQVSLTYTAKEKLASGDYKIQINCNEKNIGNCRVRLK